MKCCICGREREAGTTITLTDAEKHSLRRMTSGPIPDSYFYCTPCWGVVNNRQQGAQLLKGLLQASLSKSGVRNAEQIATRYYQLLLQGAAKKPVS